jgi:hypothetical protein
MNFLNKPILKAKYYKKNEYDNKPNEKRPNMKKNDAKRPGSVNHIISSHQKRRP